MALDFQHQKLHFKVSEIPHHYGEKIHILSSPLMLSFLAKLGHPDTHQPQINELTNMLYTYLIDQVIDSLFPRKHVNMETRMKATHAEASFEGEIVDPGVRCVTVDLARAG